MFNYLSKLVRKLHRKILRPSAKRFKAIKSTVSKFTIKLNLFCVSPPFDHCCHLHPPWGPVPHSPCTSLLLTSTVSCQPRLHIQPFMSMPLPPITLTCSSFHLIFFFRIIFHAFMHFLKFYFIFKLYNIVLVLPNIEMNPPQVYLCSPSWTRLPPPSPYPYDFVCSSTTLCYSGLKSTNNYQAQWPFQSLHLP